MKESSILAWLFILTVPVAQVLAAESVPPKSETDKINYSVGYQIGGDFLRQGVGMNAEALSQGIRDALEKREPLLSAQEMTTTLMELKKKIVADERLNHDRKDQDFLVENRKKAGVGELPNGIQYRMIAAGSGPKPAMADSVKINFLAKTTDGTLVSDTFKANDPKIYAMGKVLPGLQAVLPMMQEGSRWEVVIPVGHEGRRRNESLDARGTLIYEIELLSVIPAEMPKK
jgi:FKBP-type peptidyl-prolyl cis-trans isomerase FklB